MAIDSFMSQKKMVKWGFQGVYVCMLLVDFMLLFNVCSLVLMIYWDIVRGGLGS